MLSMLCLTAFGPIRSDEQDLAGKIPMGKILAGMTLPGDAAPT
jgi:hypothetical protein